MPMIDKEPTTKDIYIYLDGDKFNYSPTPQDQLESVLPGKEDIFEESISNKLFYGLGDKHTTSKQVDNILKGLVVKRLGKTSEEIDKILEEYKEKAGKVLREMGLGKTLEQSNEELSIHYKIAV